MSVHNREEEGEKKGVFEYNELVLKECAHQVTKSNHLTASMAFLEMMHEEEEKEKEDNNDDVVLLASCRQLYKAYRHHYNRRVTDNRHEMALRWKKFLSNVHMIHQFNNNNNNNNKQHVITLNQFSDRLPHEYPLGQSQTTENQNADGDWFQQFLKSSDTTDTSNNPNSSLSNPKVIHLDSEESIRSVFQELHVHQQANNNNNNHENNRRHLSSLPTDFDSYLNWATTDNPDGVSLVHPPVDQGACGSCWAFATTGTLETSVTRNAIVYTLQQTQNKKTSSRHRDHLRRHGYHHHHQKDQHQTSTASSETNSTETTPPPPLDFLTQLQALEQTIFQFVDTSAQELVDCDYFSLGCLGGNPVRSYNFIRLYGLTSRRLYPYVGYYPTEDYQDDDVQQDDGDDKLIYYYDDDNVTNTSVSFPNAITSSLNKETTHAMFQNILSDNGDDSGGDDSAPLVNINAKMCRQDLVNRPIVTVSSWGVLAPNDENKMELILRYIGPIAVGINASDPTFLAYSGGIYSNDHANANTTEQADNETIFFETPPVVCTQQANHAMLVVGYGEEQDEATGETTRYWIARNSWGTEWGENGYVRIKRQIDGSQGHEGVCGIARAPNVALDGILLSDSLEDDTSVDGDDSNRSDEEKKLKAAGHEAVSSSTIAATARSSQLENLQVLFPKQHQEQNHFSYYYLCNQSNQNLKMFKIFHSLQFCQRSDHSSSIVAFLILMLICVAVVVWLVMMQMISVFNYLYDRHRRSRRRRRNRRPRRQELGVVHDETSPMLQTERYTDYST